MIIKYINTDYNYPIHIYFDIQQLFAIVNNNNNVIRKNELHIHYSNTGLGSCERIECKDCPIEYECNHNSNIYNLIPDNFKNEYPELFI